MTTQSGQAKGCVLCALFLTTIACADALSSSATSRGTAAGTSRQELIEIMENAHLVPELGKDEPLCKTFYEDFKKQTNIKHIEPIDKAESYDDPALAPYRDQCPRLDFRKSLSVPANYDTTGWTDADWETLGRPTYGLHNFQVYEVDINNNPNDGKEFVFYYEGEKTLVSRLPVGRPREQHEIVDPGGRRYTVFDLKSCKTSPIGQVAFNQNASAKWTRNGIMQFRGKNAFYDLISTDEGRYYYLTLHLYSKRLTHIAPTCSYSKPRK